jgi:hypothetical protein
MLDRPMWVGIARDDEGAQMTARSIPTEAGREDRRVADFRVVLVRWAAYTVVISVLPVVFNALGAVTRGQPVRYDDLVANGELLLVSVAICAAAAGELSTATAESLVATRSLLVAMSLVTAVLAAWWFADVTSAVRAHGPVDRHAIAVWSSMLFAFATVTGACCMIVSRWTS